MAKRDVKDKIKLKGYDDLFGDDEVIASEGSILEVPLDELYTFKNHPFRVVDDEKMDETVASVKKFGVLVPGIARPREEGGYEVLSGHRRKRASELAKKTTMPMIIKNCTDDEATIIMVDANIQREDILPSEKARAYKMKYEALKHRGKAGGVTVEMMAESAGESSKTVQRYVWLGNLIDELLQFVDEKKLGVVQGVDISFLAKDKQEWILDLIANKGCSLTTVQTAQIRELDKEGSLTREILNKLVLGEKTKPRRVVFNAKRLDSYFAPNMTNEDIESVIVKLLEEWKEKGGGS